MATIEERNAGINKAIEANKGMEAFEEYYADNVVMMENDQAHEGKEVNRKRQEEFWNMVETVHAAEVKSSAVNGLTSFTELAYDFTWKDGNRFPMNEVSVRRWNEEGMIVHERFYYKGMG